MPFFSCFTFPEEVLKLSRIYRWFLLNGPLGKNYRIVPPGEKYYKLGKKGRPN